MPSEWYLRRKYNLTVEEYKALLAKQGNCCAICKKGSKRGLHIDHDHLTGEVRALLCSPCNSGLGMFKDDIRLLAQAIVYLEDNGKTWNDNLMPWQTRVES